jgi:hypothetical protein
MSKAKCNICNILIEDIRKRVIELFYDMPGEEIISCNEQQIKNLLE